MKIIQKNIDIALARPSLLNQNNQAIPLNNEHVQKVSWWEYMRLVFKTHPRRKW